VADRSSDQHKPEVTMFEKLLTLLLHGKGALAAGVLVAGTAGVVITGTFNGANVTLSVTPADSASTTIAGSPATTPATAPLSAAQLLSPSKPTNTTSTSGDNGSDCSDAAHLRNDAKTAARVVWMQGRAALELLDKASNKAKGEDHSNGSDTAKTAIDQARKDALAKIQAEWQTVACNGNDDENKAEEDKDNNNVDDGDKVDENKNDQSVDEDKDNDDSKSATTVKVVKTTTSNPTVTTGTTTATNTASIKFDTSKLGRYAKFIDDEVAAVNKALSDAANAGTTSNSSTTKDRKKSDNSKHQRGQHEGDD
jgi:hypothetical protein